METTVDRFLTLWEEEELSAPWLNRNTGIDTTRWYSIKQRKVMRTNEVEAIQKIYPEYAVWLTTGLEMPEAGHISPMTKKAQNNLKTAPKAG